VGFGFGRSRAKRKKRPLSTSRWGANGPPPISSPKLFFERWEPNLIRAVIRIAAAWNFRHPAFSVFPLVGRPIKRLVTFFFFARRGPIRSPVGLASFTTVEFGLVSNPRAAKPNGPRVQAGAEIVTDAERPQYKNIRVKRRFLARHPPPLLAPTDEENFHGRNFRQRCGSGSRPQEHLLPFS